MVIRKILTTFTTEFCEAFKCYNIFRCFVALFWLQIKIEGYVFIHLFYFFVYNRFIQCFTPLMVMFLVALMAEGYEVIFLFYLSFMLECVIFSVLFKYNEVVKAWVYDKFSYEFVSLLTGSFDYRALIFVWAGILAYIIARVSDDFLSHMRLMDAFGTAYEQIASSPDFKYTHESLEKAAELAKQMSTGPSLPALERQVVASAKAFANSVMSFFK